MRNFRFENIWLLSKQEQGARSIEFKKTNLIVGLNHTGKSTLIKSIFIALGATPKGSLARWDRDAICLLEFSVDSKRFRVLHQNGYRALFSADDQLVGAAANHSEWTENLKSATGFNLVLSDKKGKRVDADARCLFLPFYINQDGSWLSVWDTFVGLQQYKAPIQPILEYFTGVKPPQWYELNSEKTSAQRDLEELKREQELVSKFRERFEKALSPVEPKLDSVAFEHDVARLTAEVTALNAEQEILRDELVREQEAIDMASLQIKLAMEALATYEGDASFLRADPHEHLVCPTCGVEHEKSFLEMLTYAEDARVLRELVVRLRGDAKAAAAAHEATRSKLSKLEERYQTVSEILSTRRGDLQFSDVVRSMGAESAFQTFEGELAKLKEQIDAALSALDTLSSKLAELTDPVRAKGILSTFRTSYSAAMLDLKVPLIDTSRIRISARPNVSGSGGPRAVLAYYSALWSACFASNGSYSMPLVIDSPQQLGQDEENLPRMIKYVANEMPEAAQVILAIETDTQEKFDQIVRLQEPYHFLTPNEFGHVNELLQPYVDRMYSALIATRP